jgi:hypothetical protein
MFWRDLQPSKWIAIESCAVAESVSLASHGPSARSGAKQLPLSVLGIRLKDATW